MQNDHNAPVILIVDDEPAIRRLLTKQLVRRLYSTVELADGQSALVWLTQNHADLVILDLMLPDIDGYEVCRRIRKRFSSSQLPILMLSALGMDVERRIEGLQAGANDIIAKPYDSKELEARVKVLVNVKNDTQRMEDLLARYTTRALRSQARLDPELLTKRVHRYATVMFADLRGFTSLSASTDTANVLSLLDEFFEITMRVIDESGGVVFDIIGDQLMAVFNVPYEVPFAGFLALQAGLEIQRQFKGLQSKWAEMGLNVGLGIGIHQGNAVVGNIGGKDLMRYSVMGNVVNVANRLLSIAADGEVVISDSLYEDVCHSPMQFLVTREDNVKLKSVAQPQTLYRVHGSVTEMSK